MDNNGASHVERFDIRLAFTQVIGRGLSQHHPLVYSYSDRHVFPDAVTGLSGKDKALDQHSQLEKTSSLAIRKWKEADVWGPSSATITF